MKKDRILSLILSVMMMFTIIFPAGVFAEEIETQEYEPEVEEVVVEIGNEEVPQQGTEQDEEPAADPVVEAQDDELAAPSEETQDDEPAAETEVAAEEEVVASETVDEESVSEEAALAAVEEEQPFVQGYVRVNGGVTVYAAESKQEEMGSFFGDAVVYATVSTLAENEAYSWLRIVFDTAEAKEAGEGLLSGYVQFKDVSVLSDEAVEQLTESLKNDYTTRSYGEKLLPVVSFALKISDEVDVVEVEVVNVDETVVVEAAAAASTAISITKQPEDVSAALGEVIELTVEATGSNLTYQWQYASGSKWYNFSGQTSSTFSGTMRKAWVGIVVRCHIADDKGNTLDTDSVTLTEKEPDPITITKQPEDVSVAMSEAFELTVEATGSNLTYQWQYASGSKWYNFSGQTSSTFSGTMRKAWAGKVVRCHIADDLGNELDTVSVTLSLTTNIVIDDVTYEPITTDTCRVVSYSGTSPSLTIPETVESMTVTEIGEEAFMDNKTLVSIDLPDTISIICARAFKGCTSLSEMY